MWLTSVIKMVSIKITIYYKRYNYSFYRRCEIKCATAIGKKTILSTLNLMAMFLISYEISDGSKTICNGILITKLLNRAIGSADSFNRCRYFFNKPHDIRSRLTSSNVIYLLLQTITTDWIWNGSEHDTCHWGSVKA